MKAILGQTACYPVQACITGFSPWEPQNR